MANKNFVVQHGLTVGPLTIDAATGDINTSGNIVITGSLGVSQISKNDSSVSINDTGSSSTVTISIDGTTEHTVDADGVNLASGDRYAIAGTSVLNATTLGTAVVNSSLTTVGNLTSLSVAGDTSVYGNLTVQGLTTLNGGTLTLGDSNTDNVVFGADINSSLKPNGPDLDLGTNSSRWGNVYAITLDVTGNITGTLLTASQPNITSVGNLTSLSASGTIETTGNVTATNLTGTLLTASQPNITTVGTLGTLAVTGNVTTGNVSGTNLTGTLLTASQTNITQVGNLTALTVAGAVNVTTSLTVDGSAYGNVVTTQFGSLFATAYGPNNYSILQAWSAPTGGALGMQAFGNIIYSSGEINFSTGKTIKDKDYPTGGVTKVTITAAGDLWANATTPSTSTTTGALVVGGGAGIAGNINAGNVIATNLTGTLLTASQTNVTSVGVLTSLAVTGNVTVGSGSATGVVTSKGSYDLTLTTNDTGASAPKITLIQSDDGNIQLDPSGTGVVTALSHLYVGNGSTEANISSLGAYNLLLSTNRDLSRATIKLSAGTNGNIDFSLNGSGTVNIPGITFGGGGTQVKAAIIGGSDTYIQYNSGGDFGGSANLTFNDVTNQITVGGAIVATTDDATALAIALG